MSDNLNAYVPGELYEAELTRAAKLERENAALRAAIEPFAQWVEKHGPRNSVGQNGAIITGEQWREAWRVAR